MDRVSVKFKTAERVGPVGEGLSAEAQAVVLAVSAVNCVVLQGRRILPSSGTCTRFRSNPLGFLSNAAREYGDLVYFKVARQHMYLVNHPDYVREILVNNQGNFVKSRALQRAKMLLGEGLLTSEGQHHLRQRRLVQPAFHRERLAGYASAMSECAVRWRERWQAGARWIFPPKCRT